MATRKMSQEDRVNLAKLLDVAGGYFAHEHVEEILGVEKCENVRVLLTRTIAVLTDPSMRLKKPTYTDIAHSIQIAADALSKPLVMAIHFSLPAGVVANRLREAIASLKIYRR